MFVHDQSRLPRIEGFHDYFVDGKTVVLVEPGNVDELSETIRLLWGDPERCKEMGINGRRFVKDRFTVDKVSQQLAKMISAKAFQIT